MKVVFVFPDLNVFQGCSRDYSGIFAHGIGNLSSTLKKHGHETALIHLTAEMERGIFLSRMTEEDAELICFTSLSHQFGYVKRLAGWVKKTLDIPTICGGIHPTIDPEDVIAADGIDMLCRGEGENALAELCNGLSLGKDVSLISNIWLKRDGKVIRNTVRSPVKNLDEIPFSDRKLFSYSTLYDYKIRMITILASRGCPYDCTYCCNHQYRELYPRDYVRFRSVDNVLSEIDEILRWYSNAEFVNFIDDTLCLNRSWTEEFCDKFPKRFNMPFHGNTHVNLLNEEMLTLLKKGGCERLDVGIESGNPRIREKVLNRNIRDSQIVSAFDLAKKFGIKLAAYNMVGIPSEAPENILETIKLNAKVSPYASHNAIFQPYPNTNLYQVCVENGLIRNKEVSAFLKRASWSNLGLVASK